MKTAHEVWSYLNEKYGAVSNDDHNLMIVEDCSTSWSSDDDDRSTSSSLDRMDGDASSVAIDDSTLSTLDGGDDGSCSDKGNDATTNSPTSRFMSQDDTKV